MTFSKALLAISLAAGMAGCAVGPDYHRPQLDAPASFHSQLASPAGAVGSNDIKEWWASFNDPTLDQLIETAVQNNLTLAQAKARVGQARAMLGAANAALAPSANIDASAARAKQSLETPLGSVLSQQPGFDRYGNMYEANLEAGWEIDVFGGLRRGREAAVADWQSSKADLAATTLSVEAETADTYVAIRALQARLQVAHEQVDTQGRLADTIRRQFDAGVASELQLDQAQGALAQVQATIPALETAQEAAMNALDVLLGRQPGTSQRELATVTPIPNAPALADADGPAGLLRRRPDVIASERRLAASNARIGEAVSEYYPKFSLGGLIGTATGVAGHQFTGGASQAQGVLGLHWRLFDFGRVNAEIAEAKGRNAEALADYRLTVLRASEDVENAFTAYLKYQEQEQILTRGELSLSKAEKSSEMAYNGGSVSLIEVLDANSRLLATRDARVQAQAQVTRAAIASFRALGGGWNTDAPAVASQPATSALKAN